MTKPVKIGIRPTDVKLKLYKNRIKSIERRINELNKEKERVKTFLNTLQQEIYKNAISNKND